MSTSLSSNMAEAIVVDSAAFIKGAKLETMGKEIYTLPEVIAELKDEKTRQRLELPQLYTLKYREPSGEALEAVTSFSKKTGDYKSLSAVDMKVLALTWMLEKEKHGGVSHLNTEPFTKIHITNRPAPVVASNAQNSGFYFPKSKAQTQNILQSLPEPIPFSLTEFLDSTSKKEYEVKMNITPSTDSDEENKGDDSEQLEGEANNDIDEGEEEEEGDEDNVNEDDEDDDDDDDDEAGWITPQNIHLANAAWKDSGATEAPINQVKVGCVTTDFAMQNVLIQMGLKVISVDGMLIKKAKQFVLKCHACFKITTDMSKDFCPTCGNATLLKIAVSVDDSGVITHFQSLNSKKLSLKGSIYSIPLPKGGRVNNDLILREDQKERQARIKASRKKGVDMFDEDFIPYASPFAPIDMKMKAAPSAQFGFGKRNPNESRQKTGKRKKSSNTR